MIVKKIFNPLAVVRYMVSELIISFLFAVFAYFVVVHFKWNNILLPFAIAAILGSALSIFIAFRNQSAYARWWEARTAWAGIVNSSRVFARLVRTFTDSHRHQANYDEARSTKFKRDLINMQIAWAHALRIQLREQNDWTSLEKYLSSTDFRKLRGAKNKTNVLQTLMGEHIYTAMSNGTLAGFDSFQIEGQLLALANHQGTCERIKQTPLLRQYHYFTKLFLLVFMAALPFALVGDLIRLEIEFILVPISVLISFVFATMAKVGEVNEDPFENRITDVPLSSLCNTIERDLLEILEENILPKEIQEENGYLN